MVKFSSVRFDVAPKRSEYQQTQRYIFPVFFIWIDGKKYKSVGFALGWWKWIFNFFFDTDKPVSHKH